MNKTEMAKKLAGTVDLSQAKAAEVIEAGGRIDFSGASGRLIFDGEGDRPSQGMQTFGPNDTATDWAVVDIYDDNLQKVSQ